MYCLTCGNETPLSKDGKRHLKYCNFTCQGKSNGFSKKSTQDKIKQTVLEKYGVENISLLQDTKDKISTSNSGENNPFFGKQHTKEHKSKVSKQAKKRWTNPDFKKKTSEAIKQGINTEKELQRRREWARDNWDLSGRLSKVHQSIRDELNLEELGFESEVAVFGYSADEMKDNIIIEINGDHIHANPKKYKADDIIQIKGDSYTAQEKWDKDKQRKEQLESAGFKVFVIWESDDESRKQEIINQVRNM